MIHVARLFSPQHAVKAAQALKGYKWTQLEYTGFLERVAMHHTTNRDTLGKMAPDTLKCLFNFLPKVSNPLLRRVCLDYLQSLGDNNFKHLCCTSFVSTECYEEACEFIDPNSDTCNEIIAFGGADQVYSAVRNEQIPNTLWSRLFESFVSTDNYEAARELWLRIDRPPFKACGEETVLGFVELIGRYKDKNMLKQFLKASGENGELSLKSSAIAACLNCFTEDPELWKAILLNEPMLKDCLVLQDGRFVSDALAKDTLQLLTQFRTENIHMVTLLGNLLLQGIYRRNTSRSVLHAYRLLVNEFQFEPNQDTAQILANAAYRLGNSKLLSYEIWKDVTARSIQLDRRFYETVLMCQLVGSGYRSTLFFVSEMFRQQVPLRGHIQRILFNKFERVGETAQLLSLFQQRRPTAIHTSFDVSQAEAESESLQQARANADVFLYGHRPETEALVELQNMLAFDKRKEEKKATLD